MGGCCAIAHGGNLRDFPGVRRGALFHGPAPFAPTPLVGARPPGVTVEGPRMGLGNRKFKLLTPRRMSGNPPTPPLISLQKHRAFRPPKPSFLPYFFFRFGVFGESARVFAQPSRSPSGSQTKMRIKLPSSLYRRRRKPRLHRRGCLRPSKFGRCAMGALLGPPFFFFIFYKKTPN